MALSRKYYQVTAVFLIFIQHQLYSYLGVCGGDIVLLGPTHQNVYVPLNSEQRFNCTGLHAGDDDAWLIRLPRRNEQDPEVNLQFFPRSLNELTRRQISRNVTQISGDNISTTILTIRALNINSGILAQCGITVNGSLTSYSATMTVYGPPMAPNNLTVSDINIQSVKVSWSNTEMAIPGVDTSFEITVENIRLANKTIDTLDLNYYVFNGSENASSCDLYQFGVKARNDAGDSEISETTAMLPSVPTVSNLNASLGYHANKSNIGIRVSITFSNAGFCEEYPVTKYTVMLNSTTVMISKDVHANPGTSTVTVSLGPSDGLEENQLYSYYVTASNAAGNTSSDIQDLYTSDVLRVEVVVNSNIICCRFIEGTDARGCLVGFETERNGSVEYVKLDRTSNSLFAQSQVLSNLLLGTSVDRIFGLDIESDGSNGTLPIPAVRGSCSGPGDGEEPTILTTLSSDGPKSNSSTSLIVGIAIVVIVMLSFPAVSILIYLCCIYFNKKKGVAVSKVLDTTDERYKEPHSSLNKSDNVNGGETIGVPMYDLPDKITAPESSVFLGSPSSQAEYHTLTHDESRHSHMASPVTQQAADTSDFGLATNYAQLDESSVQHHYAVLESNPQEPFYAEPSTVAARHRGASNSIATDPNAPPLPPAMYSEIGREEEPSSSSTGRITKWPYSSSSATSPPSSGTDIL